MSLLSLLLLLLLLLVVTSLLLFWLLLWLSLPLLLLFIFFSSFALVHVELLIGFSFSCSLLCEFADNERHSKALCPVLWHKLHRGGRGQSRAQCPPAPHRLQGPELSIVIDKLLLLLLLLWLLVLLILFVLLHMSATPGRSLCFLCEQKMEISSDCLCCCKRSRAVTPLHVNNASMEEKNSKYERKKIK